MHQQDNEKSLSTKNRWSCNEKSLPSLMIEYNLVTKMESIEEP